MSLTEGGGVLVRSVDWDSWDVGDISLETLLSFLISIGFSCSCRTTVGNGSLPISSLSKRILNNESVLFFN
jgi:hypothetical protein